MHSKNISGQQDLMNFARNTPVSASLLRIPKKIFAPPQPPPAEGEETLEYNVSARACASEGHRIIDVLMFLFACLLNRTIYLQCLKTSSSLNVKRLFKYDHH